MAKTTLYYDLDDKVLWVVEGDRKYPVYTYANLNAENTRLDQGEYLLVKDGDSGDWVDVLGADGKKVSLKGEPGKPGKDADDVISYDIYDVILSNAMDQVYVDENYCINPNQDDVYSYISIYKNGALTNKDDWNITLAGPYTDKHLIYFDGDRIVSDFENAAGILLTSTQLVYVVTCTLADNENVSISKQFTLKRIQGSVDYDLLASRQVIRLKANGLVADSSKDITVKIKARTIGLNSNVKYLTPQDLPSDYTISYQWTNGDEISIDNTGVIDVSQKTGIQDTDNLKILLQYQGDTIDEITIECVKDGTNASHIELSDDFDQIFVEDGKVVERQEFYTTVSYFEGDDLVKLEKGTVIVSGGSDYVDIYKDEVGDKVKLTIIPTGKAPTEDRIKILIEVGSSTKTYTLQKLSGSIDYDLYVTPGYLFCKYDDNGNIIGVDEKIEVKITERKVSAASTDLTYIMTLPEGYTLSYSIDSNDGGYLLLEDGIAQITIQEETSDPPRKVTITLMKAGEKEDDDSVVVDFSEVAILRDGPKGAAGAPGYYLNIENDYDQLYKKDGKLIPGQTYKTNFYLYQGSTQLTLKDDQHTTISVDKITTSEWSVVNCGYGENGEGVIEIAFTDIDVYKFDPDWKSLKYTLNVHHLTEDNQVIDISHDIRIAIIDSTVDYDFVLDTTSIRKDGYGNLIGDQPIGFTIKKKDLISSTATVKSLATFKDLDDNGLEVWVSVNDGSPDRLTGDGESLLNISKETQRGVTNYLTLKLYKKDDLNVAIDSERIIVVQDGTEAKILTVSIPNDTELLYVNSEGKLISTFWHFLKGYELYEGSTQCSGVTWTLEQVLGTYKTAIEVGDNENTGEFEIAIGFLDNSTKIEDQQLVFKLTGTLEDGRSAFTFIKFIILKGTVDYDLHTNHETIHRDVDGNCTTSPIYVWVSAKGLVNSGDTSNHEKYDWTLTHIVKYNISNEDEPNWAEVSYQSDLQSGRILLSPNAFGTLQAPTLTIQLIEKGTEILIDETILNVYSDGTPGAPGYTCNLTNDTELVYFDPDGKLKADVSLITEVQAWLGSLQLTYNKDFWVKAYDSISGQPEPEYDYPIGESIIEYACVKGFDKSLIPTSINCYFYSDEECTKLIGQKEFKILHIQGDWDYDLYLPATIPVDANGIAKEDLVVRIKKSDTSDPSNFLISEKLPANADLAILPTINGTGLVFVPSWSNRTLTIPKSTLNANAGTSLVVLLGKVGFTTDPTRLLDEETIPFVKDGDKGDKGDDAVTVVVTADLPNIWVDEGGYLLGKETDTNKQRASFTLTKYKGKDKIAFTDTNNVNFDVPTIGTGENKNKLFYGIDSGNNNSLSIYLDPFYNLIYDQPSYKCAVTVDNITVNLTINRLKGVSTYDLKCSPSAIKYDPNENKFEQIECKVFRKCSGGGYTKDLELITSGNIGIAVSTIEETPTSTSITLNGGIGTFKPTKAVMHEFQLHDSETEALLDYDILPVVSDGTLKAKLLEITDTNDNVVAGLNGTTDSNVFVWGGGTFAQADSGTTSTFINKDGTGKIGPLQLVNTDEALIGTTDDNGLIKLKSTANGGSCINLHNNANANVNGRPSISLATSSDIFKDFDPFTNLQMGLNKVNFVSSVPGSKKSIEELGTGGIYDLFFNPIVPSTNYVKYTYTNQTNSVFKIEGICYAINGIYIDPLLAYLTTTISFYLLWLDTKGIICSHEYEAYVDSTSGVVSLDRSFVTCFDLPPGKTVELIITINGLLTDKYTDINDWVNKWVIKLQSSSDLLVGISPTSFLIRNLPVWKNDLDAGQVFRSVCDLHDNGPMGHIVKILWRLALGLSLIDNESALTCAQTAINELRELILELESVLCTAPGNG